MIVKAVFQVCKNDKTNTIQNIDGRLLSGISINDELYICGGCNEYLDLKDENNGAQLDADKLSKVNIIEIYSYGRQWENLDAGMTARIKCQCDKVIEKDEIIFKIIT